MRPWNRTRSIQRGLVLLLVLGAASLCPQTPLQAQQRSQRLHANRPVSQARVARTIDRLYQRGKWSTLVRVYNKHRGVLGDDRLAREKMVVALNKTKQFERSLAEIQRYLGREAPGGISRVNLATLDKLDPRTRRHQKLNGEILAAAGKAFRELSDLPPTKLSANARSLITSFARSQGITAGGSLARAALQLSTQFYEAGYFQKLEHYPLINAAHNNYRLGNTARAARLAWKALEPGKKTDHGKADYWSLATKLEAHVLSGEDIKRVPRLFTAAARMVGQSWEAGTTANTLKGTLTTMRKSTGATPADTALGDAVVRRLGQLRDNPQLGNNKRWLRSAQRELAKLTGPGNGIRGLWRRVIGQRSVIPSEYARVSSAIRGRTVEKDWRQKHTKLSRIYHDAGRANPKLRRLVATLARELGGQPLFPPATAESRQGLKSRTRARQRISDFSGDASQLTDIARASLVFKSLDGVYRALRALDSRADIVAIKDRFLQPYASGYRDILTKVRMSNGHVVEIQLHLEPILAVKNGPGHKLYEKQRAYWSKADTEGRDLQPAERKAVEGLDGQMRRLYEQAYRAGHQSRRWWTLSSAKRRQPKHAIGL